ncbi:MAG TPA: protein kinase [Thermoanaerobaculia bacterium]|jgi:serine/threonine-protein kinase|nr:protein kinase [Thermoanaerobaculia bacterium]
MGSTRETLGHYEIIRPIGAGGMGEVFVARDPKLGRKVAIKLLPSRLAGDRDTLSRFTQEARSASALNHPNIVTIHEVGATEDAPFIVMEFIDGRDLRTLIGEGPLPVRQVLDIATQIADGLAAAHERGIVHRDLKPENIMLTRDSYVKILDFGLAKVIGPAPEGEHTIQLEMPGTMPGTILGTVGYMSPEQATGKRIDFRSDLFAFGAILHELTTGTPAFDGETAIDTLSAILHHDPPPVTKSNARAPVQFADIIKRLLAKSANDRYSSTRDLARELKLLRERVVAEESGFHKQPPQGTRKPLLAIVGALALAAFLAVAVYVIRKPHPVEPETPPPIAKKYLAVMRFSDLSGDPNGQLVVDGFAETLTARLAHFPTLQVMRPPAADPGTGDPRKMAKDLGANLVLTGSMMRDGERIRVTYTILDSQSGREWRDLLEGNVSNLFGVQDDVADSVARNLDLGTASVKVALDPAVSQRRYLEALGHLRRYDNDESVDAAIEILEDLGGSPSVQAALARAYLYKFQNTHRPELAAAAGKAAETALQADPQSLDVNVTLGELHRQTGRHKEAIDAFVRVLSQQPNNADAVLGLAEAYKASGDFRNAEAQYKRAIALQPNYWGGYNKLGAFYYTQSRFQNAVPQFQRVVQLVPDNERGYNNLGGMYLRLGRFDDAVRVFQQSIQRKPSGHAYSNLGTSYYFAGRFREAAAAFEKATQLEKGYFAYWRNLGDAYRWVPGAEESARRAFLHTIELCDDSIRVNPNESRAYMARASALAKLGRHREARTSILRALELDPQYAANIYEAAVIANLGGSEEDAVARLEQALRLGYSPDDMMRDPELANLRKSGRLQAIIAGYRSTPKR